MGNIANKARYKVSVTSSWHHPQVGSEQLIFLEMISQQGESTDLIPIEIPVEKSDTDQTDVFDVDVDDVGMPWIIKLELGYNVPKDSWMCKNIVIEYIGEKATFPVYDWVDKEIYVTAAKALTFAQSVHPELRSLRQKEIELNREKFQWADPPATGGRGWGLPRHMKTVAKGRLPILLNPTEARLRHVYTTVRSGMMMAKKASFASKDCKIKLDTLQEYSYMYDFLQKDLESAVPDDSWQSDIEFGHQQMNGTSPTSYHRCTKLPECCQISDEHVSDLLCGDTLEREMMAGKIYIADYSEVYQGVARNTNSSGVGLHCPDAICLYLVLEDGNLMPIAIQLVPGDADTIFTPKDSFEDWLLAKMYFKVAMGNLHQWYYAFLLTIAVTEPFAVSLFRNLPRSHPIYKLLRPHVQHVCGTNLQARKILMSKHSASNQATAIDDGGILRKMFKAFSFDDLLLPEVLEKKGIDDPQLLPSNYYRDDSLELWKIIEEFVGSTIKVYYKSDKDVERDDEIQTWLKEASCEGFGWMDEDNKDVPESTETVEQLIDICTRIIFTCSVQYAAVTSAEYETYKYIPSAPLAMLLPPHKRGEGTMERIMKSLPDMSMSTSVITVAYVMSTKSPDEVYLGKHEEKFFDEDETDRIFQDFQTSLKTFSERVKARNEGLDRPYDTLLPEKIPNGISL